jgi:YjbE family integral membrane protein
MHAQFLDPAAWIATFGNGWNGLDRTGFWIAMVQIVWINLVLSGDNAVVIAMACRGLPRRQRLWGLMLGSGVAVLLRIFFTGVIATLMLLPYIKIAGGLVLLYIAARLLVPEAPDHDQTEAVGYLWRAVRVVAVADVVMSLDNVIAIAAAANGNAALLVLGLAISIPLVVVGAALIMGLLARVPLLVWAGAALLGWVAGQVIATDPVSSSYLTAAYGESGAKWAAVTAGIAGAVLVVVAGGLWRRAKAAPGGQI